MYIPLFSPPVPCISTVPAKSSFKSPVETPFLSKAIPVAPSPIFIRDDPVSIFTTESGALLSRRAYTPTPFFPTSIVLPFFSVAVESFVNIPTEFSPFSSITPSFDIFTPSEPERANA